MIKISPKKISELDLAGTLTGAEDVALVQSNQTVRALLSTLKTYIDQSGQITLVSRSDTVATGADTIETYLQTYTLEPNTLANNGEWLDIFASGTFAGNANTKLLTFHFGSTSFSSYADAFSSVANNWEINIRLQRTTNTLQKANIKISAITDVGVMANPSSASSIETPTETLSSAIPLAISGTNGTASANDITMEQFIIVHYKLDPDS